MTDAGPPPPAVEVVTMRDMEGNPTTFGPADFSCAGTVTAPAGGADVSFTLGARAFGGGGAVADLEVQLFPDNLVDLAGCMGTCQRLTTDASGDATAMDAEGSWYAYRIPAQAATIGGSPGNVVEVMQFNEDAPAAMERVTANAVSEGTQSAFIAVIGVSREEGTAVVTGVVNDCMGRAVQNANVRVFDANGRVELTFLMSGPREFYFNGNPRMTLPLGTRRRTNNDGLYGAANLVVPSDNRVRVEAWGVLSEGGQPEMLGCERVLVSPDAITIVNIGPSRSDGPSDCSGWALSPRWG